MTTISKRESDTSYIERYYLDEMYPGRAYIWPGVLLFYLLATYDDIKLQKITVEAEHFHDNSDWYFDSITQVLSWERFKDWCDSERHAGWECSMELRLSGEYKNVTIDIYGRTDSAMIDVSYRKSQGHLDLSKLFTTIEQESWRHHEYDDEFVNNIKDTYQMTLKSTVQMLDKISNHQNLYNEFLYAPLDPDKYPDDMISIRGYTAKMLHEDYAMSKINAYSCIVDMWYKPDQVIADLEAEKNIS